MLHLGMVSGSHCPRCPNTEIIFSETFSLEKVSRCIFPFELARRGDGYCESRKLNRVVLCGVKFRSSLRRIARGIDPFRNCWALRGEVRTRFRFVWQCYSLTRTSNAHNHGANARGWDFPFVRIVGSHF